MQVAKTALEQVNDIHEEDNIQSTSNTFILVNKLGDRTLKVDGEKIWANIIGIAMHISYLCTVSVVITIALHPVDIDC